MVVEENELREFKVLLQKFSSNISAAEYINTPASKPMVNEHEIDWQQKKNKKIASMPS